MSNQTFDRRSFLKGAAASAAAVLGTQLAANAQAQTEAPSSAAKEAPPSRDKVIARPGSDYMTDVIKATGINTSRRIRDRAAACRNRCQLRRQQDARFSPACMRNLLSPWPMAAPGTGKPMGIIIHGAIGLQHTAMGVYSAGATACR